MIRKNRRNISLSKEIDDSLNSPLLDDFNLSEFVENKLEEELRLMTVDYKINKTKRQLASLLEFKKELIQKVKQRIDSFSEQESILFLRLKQLLLEGKSSIALYNRFIKETNIKIKYYEFMEVIQFE